MTDAKRYWVRETYWIEDEFLTPENRKGRIPFVLASDYDQLRQQLEQVQGELGEWKAGRMADASGHLFLCAKVNGKWSCSNGCAVAERDTLQARVGELEKRDDTD